MSHELHRLPRPTLPDGRRLRNEAGSAYVAALLVLVLLTIIGLSLSLITQTEMQIGANENLIERVFYASDAGIQISTATTLVTRRPAWSQLYLISEPAAVEHPLEHRIDVSPFYPVAMSPCNLCDINNAGQYGSRNYQRVVSAVTSTAVRRVPGTQIQLGERTITAMMEFQPWEIAPEQILAAENKEQLKKIKF
jgi:Tfp pilus assembly protein PilX